MYIFSGHGVCIYSCVCARVHECMCVNENYCNTLLRIVSRIHLHVHTSVMGIDITLMGTLGETD